MLLREREWCVVRPLLERQSVTLHYSLSSLSRWLVVGTIIPACSFILPLDNGSMQYHCDGWRVQKDPCDDTVVQLPYITRLYFVSDDQLYCTQQVLYICWIEHAGNLDRNPSFCPVFKFALYRRRKRKILKIILLILILAQT